MRGLGCHAPTVRVFVMEPVVRRPPLPASLHAIVDGWPTPRSANGLGGNSFFLRNRDCISYIKDKVYIATFAKAPSVKKKITMQPKQGSPGCLRRRRPEQPPDGSPSRMQLEAEALPDEETKFLIASLSSTSKASACHRNTERPSSKG